MTRAADIELLPKPVQTFYAWFPFQGRISRSGFWLTYLLVVDPAAYGLHVMDAALGRMMPTTPLDIMLLGDASRLLATALVLWMTVSVFLRRAHDLGWSGHKWWLLIVPFVNVVVLWRLMFKAGIPDRAAID
jgi:uncharacterized membrane protein YhaH (DUF805 family)